jgi:hypothetical protein
MFFVIRKREEESTDLGELCRIHQSSCLYLNHYVSIPYIEHIYPLPQEYNKIPYLNHTTFKSRVFE